MGVHYGQRRVDELSDFDQNWFPRVLRDYESALTFSKLKIVEENF